MFQQTIERDAAENPELFRSGAEIKALGRQAESATSSDTIQLEDIASPKVREEIAAIEAAAVATAPTPPRRSSRKK